jgi:hypothetical protein
MDIVQDPLRAGREEGHSGIFYCRVIGTRIGITYIPDEDSKRVVVADISTS